MPGRNTKTGVTSGEAVPGTENSRQSSAGAGWHCAQPGSYKQLLTRKDLPFSWLSPVPLWQSRNDRLARWFGDPTDDRRRAWMEGRGEGNPDLALEYPGSESSFLVMGDTGEGDASQYAVVPPLRRHAGGTSFLFICSDVIYPAGGINAYEEKFARPYREYDGAIHGVPGNHDWYDDCTGFMYWFCGAEAAPRWQRDGRSLRRLVRRLLWRRPPRSRRKPVEGARAMRALPGQQARQPAPYLVIDAGPVRLIGIDTGIRGDIDREQGEWLRRVSRNSPKPKILLTGKPIYVDGEHHPGPIEGGGTVDEIVVAPEHNYIAAIGGDIHNYQRYPVTLKDGRTLLYLVSGGGGAFMHETHTIPNLDTAGLAGVSELEFRCYPMRGDSLSRFSQLYAHKLRWLGPLGGALFIPPDEAAAIVGEQLGITPVRPSARGVEVSNRARRAARILFTLPTHGRRGLHVPFSEWLDWNEPPLFKSFLRIDATSSELRIRCYGATGCGEQEQEPPVEDDLRSSLEADGSWQWIPA
jgi:hypothetical protein